MFDGDPGPWEEGWLTIKYRDELGGAGGRNGMGNMHINLFTESEVELPNADVGLRGKVY